MFRAATKTSPWYPCLMKIWIVRHGDPDYSIDSLTEMGKKQADLLAETLMKHHFDEIYLSPLGRAQRTAKPYLELSGRKPDGVLDWLQELPWVWDRAPEIWTKDPLAYDPEKWIDCPIFEADPFKERYKGVETSFYRFLEEKGYKKNGGEFLTDGSKNEKSIVFFCHMGLGSFLLSRLINVSPAVTWMNFFLPTSSITLAQTEEMNPGHAHFRIRELGALPHLEDHQELYSEAGAFRESALSEGRKDR